VAAVAAMACAGVCSDAGAHADPHAHADPRAPAAPHVPAHAQAAAGTHLQVSEVEYRLMLSEAVVKAGPVDLEAIDAGMDPHDLRLRRGGGPVLFGTQPLAPGQILDAVVDLRPGTYHLWCSLPGHWRLGMHATLRVVR
jgi:hypothetical protein